VETDAYTSVMALFAMESRTGSWKDNPAVKQSLEITAFEILVALCNGSHRGLEVVRNSPHILQCVSRAMETVSSRVVADFHLIDCADDHAQNEEDTPIEEKLNVEGLVQGNGMDRTESVDMGLDNLAMASLSFLSGLVPASNVREVLLQEEKFTEAVISLCTHLSNSALSLEAVKLLHELSHYVSKDHSLSLERLATVLHNIMIFEVPSTSAVGAFVNSCLLNSTALMTIQVIFDGLERDTQIILAQDVAARFVRLVKNLTAARGDRSNTAMLAFNSTLVLLLLRGKDVLGDTILRQVLTALVHFIQWRHDPKTCLTIDIALWNAAVNHSLQLLYLTISTTE